MYQDPNKTRPKKASERIEDKRSKYSVSSGKQQAKKALGGIGSKLSVDTAPEEVQLSGAEATSSYRVAYNELRETMTDASPYSDMDVDLGEDAIASRPPEYNPRPRIRGEGGKLSFDERVSKVQRDANDPDFRASVKELSKEFNITDREVYSVINGENSDWAWDVTNNLGYKGLFQVGKTPAEEAGIDYENLTSMKPSQQVREYAKYLRRWGYDGSVPLAVMQAAPGKAKSLKGKPESTVVYAKGSKEWKANPLWRSENNGPVTIASLKEWGS